MTNITSLIGNISNAGIKFLDSPGGFVLEMEILRMAQDPAWHGVTYRAILDGKQVNLHICRGAEWGFVSKLVDDEH